METKTPLARLFRAATVLAPSCALPALTALAPALASIGEAFPELSDVAIQNLYTIPYLTAFPMVYFSGRLASVFTKKQILSVSLMVMILGGCLPLVFHSSYVVMLLAAAFYGLGFGALSPMTSALIHEHTPAEKQGWMLGVQSAVGGVVGMLFAFLGGVLAEIRWWLVYASFLLLVPVLLLTLCLPRGIIAPKLQKKQKLMNPGLVFILVFAALHHGFANVFQTNISMLVSDVGLGGADVAGIVTAFQSFAGILGGLITGWVLARLKKFALPVICAVTAAGMLLLWQGQHLWVLLCGTFVLGMLGSMRMPAGYMLTTSTAPAEQSAMMISLYCCSTQIGVFLSPHVVDAVTSGDSVTGRFLMTGIILAVMAVVGITKTFRDQKKAA